MVSVIITPVAIAIIISFNYLFVSVMVNKPELFSVCVKST
jgi:hypothetical protein